jgi:hypothetical protein
MPDVNSSINLPLTDDIQPDKPGLHVDHTAAIALSRTSTSSTAVSSTDDSGLLFDPAARPGLVSRLSQATTAVDDNEDDKYPAYTGLAVKAAPSAMPNSTSALVLSLLHALEADPAEIATKIHALGQAHGTPSLEQLSKAGIIPPLDHASPPASVSPSSVVALAPPPDAPNEAIVASIARVALRLARAEEQLQQHAALSLSSNNTTPSTDTDDGSPPSAASLAVSAASAAATGTGNAVSRLIGMYNTKASPTSASSTTSLTTRRPSGTTATLGDGDVRPEKEGEGNSEDEQLCHRCGGHIIRANEVGLADEDVIDGQSESLSAEKELKLLKAQVQDFARVCKVCHL